MARATYAVIDKDGYVVNVIAWDPVLAPAWTPGAGYTLRECTGQAVEIGYEFDGASFVDRRSLPTLAEHQALCIAKVDSTFQRLQTSMFVDAKAREQLRALALSIVTAIRACKTARDVHDTITEGLGKMQAYVDSLKG